MRANQLRLAFFSTMFGLAMFACGDATEDDATESSEAELRRGPSAAPASCTGVKVPGDYATLQAAIDSGSARICLGAGTFDEPVHVVEPQKVVIQGVGARSIVRSVHVDRGGLELAHVTVSEGVSVIGMTPTNAANPYPSPVQKVRIHDAWIRNTKWVTQGVYGPYREGVYSGGAALNLIVAKTDGFDVEVFACDIAATPEVDPATGNESGGLAVLVRAEGRDVGYPERIPARASFRGNVIHDATTGIDADIARLEGATLEVRDNQISRIRKTLGTGTGGSALAIKLDGNGSGTRIAYERNQITRSAVGAAFWKYSGDAAVVTHAKNVLSNNETNYAGLARPD